MKTRWFKKGIAYKGGWELTIFVGKFQLRIAQFQFALWKNYEAIFNYCM
jgi:hypothetical protein